MPGRKQSGEAEEAQFPQFQRLPEDLRIYIWRMTPCTRYVKIETVASRENTLKADEVLYVKSFTPCAVMQVCRESRRWSPYTKAFDIGQEPRYTWVNFDADIISIDDYELENPALLAHKADIRQLRIAVDGEDSYDWLYRHVDDELSPYIALQGLHVYMEGRTRMWASTFEACDWGSCPKDNIRFIDSACGLMLTGDELSEIDNWLIFQSVDFDEDDNVF